MPYDEELAARIREIVAGEPALTEKKTARTLPGKS